MKFAPALVALAAALSMGSAQAIQTVDVGAFTLTYDETSALGFLAGTYYSSGQRGFSWNIPSSVNVFSTGAANTGVFVLPSFKVEVNPGWALTGSVTGFMGNLVYNLVGAGASVSATVGGSLSVDGGPATAVAGILNPTTTLAVPGFESGYMSATQTASVGGPFTSFELTGLTLTLTAQGGSFSSIVAQPQNFMKVDFAVAEVPEPATVAMLLAGLALVGGTLRTRRQD
jgi:PEP-CTERM motif